MSEEMTEEILLKLAKKLIDQKKNFNEKSLSSDGISVGFIIRENVTFCVFWHELPNINILPGKNKDLLLESVQKTPLTKNEVLEEVRWYLIENQVFGVQMKAAEKEPLSEKKG